MYLCMVHKIHGMRSENYIIYSHKPARTRFCAAAAFGLWQHSLTAYKENAETLAAGHPAQYKGKRCCVRKDVKDA